MTIVTNGLIAYYNSNQGFGSGKWLNLANTGSKYDLTLVGGVTTDSNGANFDGSTGYAYCSTFTELQQNTSFSIEFRTILTNGSTSPDLIVASTSPGGGTLAYAVYPSSATMVSMSYANGNQASSTTDAFSNASYTDSVETYWSIVYDATLNTKKLYKNGSKVLPDLTTVSGEWAFPVASSYPYFNISDGSYPIAGTFDNIRIYNVVLSDNDVSTNYASGRNVDLTPQVNNYAPTTPTSLSASVNGTSVTISGIVHDQDGGTNQLVVDYSTDQTFATGVTTVSSSSINVESTGSVVISGLSPNTVYYWRVRGYDGTNYSSYSATQNFTTANVVYPTLSSFSPATQSSFTTSGTNLSVIPYSSQGLSCTVTFQISTDKTFATGVTTLTSSSVPCGTTASVATGTLTANSVYYWRAQAKDSLNNSSAWSRIFVLYTKGTVTQNLAPDAIISETNTTGAISTINDNPSSPDTTFMVPTTSGTNMVVTASFPTPTKTPLVDGAGLQTFNVYAKRTNTNGTTTMTIAVLENGTTIATSSAITVTSTTGATSSFTWDATSLTDQTGAGVQIKITTTAYNAGSKKTDINIGAVQWVADSQSTPATVSDPNPTDTTAPNNVSSLHTTSVGMTTVNLSWMNPTDSDYSYSKVYRNATLLGTSISSTYSDSGLTSSTTYTYKVTTVDQAGNESNGATLGVTTTSPDTTPPANVTSLVATPNHTSVSLTWTNPSDSDFSKVNIYRGGTLLTTINYSPSSSGSYTDSGLQFSTNYTYKITSIDTNNNESTGTTVTTTTLADNVAPATPTGLTATGGSSKVTLSWNANTEPDLASYKLYKSTDGTNFSSYLSGLTGTTYTDNNVTNGNTYYYKLTAVDTTSNESTQTSSVSATPQLQQPPAVPINRFPFSGSAWKNVEFRADVTDDNTSLTFKVDWAINNSTLSTYNTMSVPVTLPSANGYTRASGSVSNSGAVSGNIVYWRAYTIDSTGLTGNMTNIYNYTYNPTPSGSSYSPATTWMQQGGRGQSEMIDVSSYQGTINWSQVKSSGINYAYLRSYGSDHTGNGDANFETYVSQAKSAGIKTGSYFYTNIIFPYNLNDAHTEADKFINKLYAGYGSGNCGDLMPMMDIEDNTGAPTIVAGQTNVSVTVDQMLAWCNEFRNYFQSKTGRILGIYTGDYFVRDLRNNFNFNSVTSGNASGTSGNILHNMPLWISGFTNFPRYQGNVMPECGGWTHWYGFQYTQTGTTSGVTGSNDRSWVEPIEWISPPQPVAGLSATDNGVDILLTWNQTTEQDVHDWDIYVDSSKVGSTSTNGSYTISSPTTNVLHTIEVRPIDDFGDDPILSPTTINYNLTSSPPNVSSLSVSRYKISPIQGDNVSTVQFSFDDNVKKFTININGVSHDTGIAIASGGAKTVLDVSTDTVATVSTEEVQSLNIILAGSPITINIDNTEMPSGAQGSYQVNIYGQSNKNSLWTPYLDSGNGS